MFPKSQFVTYAEFLVLGVWKARPDSPFQCIPLLSHSVYPLNNGKFVSPNSTCSAEFGKHRDMICFCETDTDEACCFSLSTDHHQLNETTLRIYFTSKAKWNLRLAKA